VSALRERSESFRALGAAARDPARTARAWREGGEGRRVIGYRCLYVPEEMITAAGMLAHPLLGTPEPVGQADAYFQPCCCELVRNIFDGALAGRFAFLDGVALANTCDVVRKLCDLWASYIGAPAIAFFNNPQRLGSELNRRYCLEELARFRGWIEERAGRAVADAELRAAIALHNRTRALLHEVHALRKLAVPPISGAEALEVALAAQVLPKPEANRLLELLLAELATMAPTAGEGRDGPRILVTGSPLDQPALLAIIDEQGGCVVADDLCTSTRYFWHAVDERLEPLEALRRHLDERALCACMHPSEARLDHLRALVHEHRAQGVIYLVLKYCHPLLYEAPLFKRRLEAEGVPTAILEVGHDRSGLGQLRTRIQAFVEMLAC
jgi:benzoyl-CoA reductase subunit C